MIVEGTWLLTIAIGVLPIAGVMSRIFGDDEEEGGEEAVDDILNDSFEDQVAFGDLEEDEDGMFDEPDDRALEEIESRVDDLEGEMGNLSSTVSTVRSENEEIATVVEDVEENVRKLLEIYEMVTRGINPFIDEEVGVGGDGNVSASIDLFEGEEEKEETSGNIDEGLLEADADEFFDEDVMDEEPLEAPPTEAPSTESAPMAADSSTDGGKSFEELKEEFESGDADWTEEEDEAASSPPEPDPEPNEAMEPKVEVNATPAAGEDPQPEPTPAEPSPAVELEEFDEAVDGSPDVGASPDPVSPGTGAQKPYLTRMPDHPVAELAVMEWIEYLVGIAGPEDAHAAVRYYGRIGWIAEPLVEEMEAYLEGFGADPAAEDTVPTGLGREEHVTTLRYLLSIDGASTRQYVGERLNGLMVEGVLGDGAIAASEPVTNTAGITAREDGRIDAPPEETTLPDGGLSLPLDDTSSTGVGRDGN